MEIDRDERPVNHWHLWTVIFTFPTQKNGKKMVKKKKKNGKKKIKKCHFAKDFYQVFNRYNHD